MSEATALRSAAATTMVVAQADSGAGAGSQAPAAASPTAPATGPLVLEPPAANERVAIPVYPGQPVALPDEIFDPGRARYVIDGDDLVVTPRGGGALVFDQFFAHPDNPPTLSVMGGPPVSASELLARADLAAPPAQPVAIAQIPVPDDQAPAAGQGRGQESAGGGAGFAPYDPGDIGPGLDPLGPLGPTALAYGAEFPEPDDAFGDRGEREPRRGIGPEPQAPTVEITGVTRGVVLETSLGFQYGSTQGDPGVSESDRLAAGRINGIDPGNVTLDGSRSLSLVFDNEVARFKSSLGVFTIDQNGAFSSAELVFPNVNSTEFDPKLPFILDGKGPLTPGDSVPLDTVEPGTQLGFFFVTNGANLNGWTGLQDGSSFPDGSFELRREGNDVTLLQNGQPVEGVLFVTVNPDPDNPQVNVLNPDGRTHVVSWYDSASGDLVFSFEDRNLAGTRTGDADFNDATFRLHFGPVTDQELFYGGAREDGAFNIAVSDDGDTLTKAEVQLTTFQTGDNLQLISGLDQNGDSIIDGTAIRIEEASATRIVFSGEDSIDRYEAALNAIRLVNTTDARAGERAGEVTVTDADGIRSSAATVTVAIADVPDDGGPGNDTLVGTDSFDALSGRGGNDSLFGRGGRDFLDGGDGDDRLFGEDGNDALLGGPGQDQLTGGAGGDRFIFTALGDGRDTILDFDAGEGDRLNLVKLFEGSTFDPGAANAGSFLRFEQFNADSDGTSDIRVIADLDGAGSDYVAAHVATLINPAGVAPGTPIQDVTTFTGSDGATS